MQLERLLIRVLDEKVANNSDFGQKIMRGSDIGSHNCGFLSSIGFATQIDRPHIRVERLRVGFRVLGRVFVFSSIVKGEIDDISKRVWICLCKPPYQLSIQASFYLRQQAHFRAKVRKIKQLGPPQPSNL